MEDTSSVSRGEGSVSLLDLASGNAGNPPAAPATPDQTATPQATTATETKPVEPTTTTEPGTDPAPTKPDADAGNVPFDKHPRFKQLISEKNELRNEVQRLREQFEALKSPPANSGDAPTAKMFADVDNAKLLDDFNEDPKGFLSKLVDSVQRQTLESFRGEQQRANSERAVIDTFKGYAEKNPDFDEMWESGEIKAFMDKNPGHNAISAHQMLTQENRIKAAADEAAKKAREEAMKEFKTKRNAAVLTGGPSAPVPTGGIPDELRDTKKFGGRTNVLAQRLAAMRASR